MKTKNQNQITKTKIVTVKKLANHCRKNASAEMKCKYKNKNKKKIYIYIYI